MGTGLNEEVREDDIVPNGHTLFQLKNIDGQNMVKYYI